MELLSQEENPSLVLTPLLAIDESPRSGLDGDVRLFKYEVSVTC